MRASPRRIRTATPKDIPQLQKLYRGVKEIIDYPGQKHDKRYFLAFMSPGRLLLVAEEKGKIAGAANGEIDFQTRFAFITNIVVAPSYRGQKVGSALMVGFAAEAKKRKCTVICGLVYDWNKPMHKIMHHLGYKPSGKTVLYTKKI
ncbi:GNAT family N-acetyltransferase [Candidatus Woesearchaeota archaeon]|nr:GNAT family N-acetyltransferase [Candidatus Woesearchaeota archaeon]